MKKNVLLALALMLLSVSPVSAQGFLKKLGDAAKKVSGTEETVKNSKADNPADAFIPVAVTIECTQIIGDKLLISGKMQAPEDFRLMTIRSSIITPDGTTYEAKEMWWGEKVVSPTGFDNQLVADINYAFALSFEIKSKKVTEIASFMIDAFNHTAQKKFKIAIKNLIVPNPIDKELSNPSVVEIYKGIYLRWTGVEESDNGFQLNFVVDNKSGKDQKIQFIDYATKITDNSGTTHEAKGTLKDRIDFPADIPVAGNITLDKPLKLKDIVLVEFASRNFNYRVREVVLPTE